MIDKDHRNSMNLCFKSDWGKNSMIHVASRVYEAAQEGICMTTTTGEIDYVNPAFTQTTGYLPEEVLGKSPRVLKSGRHSDEFYRLM